jgi:PEP-CTERM motif-containing protein
MAGFVLTIWSASYGYAESISYSFAVIGTSGPLVGQRENGTFSYDTSSVTPGDTNNATGLITALSFSWNGIAYDRQQANTGYMQFDASGDLTGFLFGNKCIAGSCAVAWGANDWFVEFSGVGSGPTGGFLYSTPQVAAAFSGVAFIPAASAPEPSTVALLSVGIAGIVVFASTLQRRHISSSV